MQVDVYKPLWHDVIHRTTSVVEVKHRSIEIVLGWGTDINIYRYSVWPQGTPGLNRAYPYKIIFRFGHNGPLGSIEQISLQKYPFWPQWTPGLNRADMLTKEFSLLATMYPWAQSSRYAYKILFPFGHNGPLGSIEQICLHTFTFGHGCMHMGVCMGNGKDLCIYGMQIYFHNN